MNERPNRRREERGSRVRDERSQNRPADYGDRPRRSSQKHKGGKVLYYGVLAILLGVLVFSSVKIISYMMEKKESEKNQQDLIDQVVTPVTPSNDNTDGNTDSSTGSEPDYISVDFAALQAKYPDVVGWIYGANTGINYPIVQTAERAASTTCTAISTAPATRTVPSSWIGAAIPTLPPRTTCCTGTI